ncbi:MAG TPA: 5'-nucleotidase C-terminal domain-containing protein [Blastocatellia bacterium]|jgi:5'-nucleotidase|nr:5'-nucleotidase C-terminal domain-containing protein [Blastocatellia bacterium]
MRFKMIFGLFCLLTISPPAMAQRQAPQAKTVTILQLNDVYQISPVDGGRRGGMARVATLRKTILSQSPDTLFLLAGDFISPSVASRLFKGKQMIDTLNSVGLDVATLGNHEFDFGADVLRERMKESRFAYTVANVFDKQTGKPFGGASRYVIREMGGVRVAVFGLLLAETASMSNPGRGVRFDDPVKVGVRLSRKLRSEGADVVIALTHLTMSEDKRLAAEADVDLIVGGHEHELLESQAGKLILKMGSDARNLGRIDISLVRGGKAGNRRGFASRPRGGKSRSRFKIQSIDFAPIPVTEATKEDAGVAAVVAGYEKELGASLAEVVGKTSVKLDARASVVRFGESNLGNFLADVYRQTLGADVALVNGGSIRSDATYGPGELTKKDILTILPFENTLVKVRLPGAHIKRLLENGVSAAGQEDGRFPQVSGMSFTYDASRPAGSRVTGIQIGGQPFEARKSYTMAVSAYVLGGGDGYDFKGAEALIKPEEGPVEPDVVMEAIRKQGTISPQVEGRIKPAQPVNRTSMTFFDLFFAPDGKQPSRHKAAQGGC